jgi:acyl dehydratase
MTAIGDRRAIDVDRARRYAALCGFPRTSTVLPPTYPHVLAWPPMFRLLRSREFPFRLIGLVHITNVISQARPLSIRDTPSFTVGWENLREHPRGRAVDVITTATVDGAVVWRECSTYLRRDRRPATAGDAPPDPKAPNDLQGARTPLAPPQTWHVTAGTVTPYSRISGDRNPIHTSTTVARLFGFPGRIAHGMWSAARCLAALGDQLPDQYTVDIAFKLPVVLPASVVFLAWTDHFELSSVDGRPHLVGDVLPYRQV